eukprot:TRINITY_DN37246_c0_g1_i2.p2 TRINITY_DN37246_c0_g1~~TRINITY_DN37246_c0_g1_i2.p2  ORF type:complete len:197 (-),score=1.15 TRINITY_DN37246_c0_g1_i2:87-677(-)
MGSQKRQRREADLENHSYRPPVNCKNASETDMLRFSAKRDARALQTVRASSVQPPFVSAVFLIFKYFQKKKKKKKQYFGIQSKLVTSQNRTIKSLGQFLKARYFQCFGGNVLCFSRTSMIFCWVVCVRIFLIFFSLLIYYFQMFIKQYETKLLDKLQSKKAKELLNFKGVWLGWHELFLEDEIVFMYQCKSIKCVV